MGLRLEIILVTSDKKKYTIKPNRELWGYIAGWHTTFAIHRFIMHSNQSVKHVRDEDVSDYAGFWIKLSNEYGRAIVFLGNKQTARCLL